MTARMTFDELSELYREEITKSSLAQVREDLYPAMADLLARLRGEYEKQLAIDPDSVMCEGAEHRRKSAARLCKEVTRVRATKICNMAFLGALGSKNPTGMLTFEEHGYYRGVLDLSREQISLGIEESNRNPIPEPEDSNRNLIPEPEESNRNPIPESQPEEAQDQAAAFVMLYRPHIRRCLEDGKWRRTTYILKALGIKDNPEDYKDIQRSLGKMVKSGEVERYPPVMPDRRAEFLKIEWRLKPKEGSE